MHTTPAWLQFLSQPFRPGTERTVHGTRSYQTSHGDGTQASVGFSLHPDTWQRLWAEAKTVGDIWQFLLQRLNYQNDIAWMALATVQDGVISSRFWHPASPDSLLAAVKADAAKPIALHHRAYADHPWVIAAQRRDTTFAPQGPTWGLLLKTMPNALNHLNLPTPPTGGLSIFTVPLIAASQPIGLISLGFSAVDTVSQAQVAALYQVRDTLAQLLWNVLLAEQLPAIPPQGPGLTLHRTALSHATSGTRIVATHHAPMGIAPGAEDTSPSEQQRWAATAKPRQRHTAIGIL